MKLYKVLKNNKAKDGGNFDYTKYLPTKTKKGKWTPIIKDISLCDKGYHVTPYWNMFYETGAQIFEVETKNVQETEEVGVIDKYVCESIRLVKEVFFTFDKNRNTGDWNTGNRNTGDWNTGYKNTGDKNTGNWNTGNWNAGNRNTGNRNTRYWNTGNRNTGDWNTGDWNTGDCNTGDCNTGDCNTGDCNTGDWNTGNWNTGDWNTGDWNTGNSNTGFFNTITPETILIFNKEYSRTEWDEFNKPDFIYFKPKENYKKSFIESFNKTTKEDVELLLKLPNFDYVIFEEISSITKAMITKKLK